jgi:uncharacterized membrane protein YhhN
VHLVALARGADGLAVTTKPVPVAVLALLVTRRGGTPAARRISAGLGLSAVADLLMEASFLAGLVAFLGAHLLYVAAFVADTRALRLARALPFAGWGVAAYAFLRPGLGPLAVPVALYVTVICLMMWRAAARVGDVPGASWGALGAVLFGASDTLIAFNRFHAPIAGASHAIMVLYWLGQAGIAASGLRPPPRPGLPRTGAPTASP